MGVKKLLVVALSVVAVFFIGGFFGFSYYQMTHGAVVVEAAPGEPFSSGQPNPSLPDDREKNNVPPDNDAESGSAEVEHESREAALPGVREEKPVAIPVSGTEVEPVDFDSVSGGMTEPSEDSVEDSVKEEKVAYITIDDGPHPRNTPAILEILADYDVKATFFVLGTSIEKNPDLITQIHEAGHAIGNHTYNHVYKDTYASDESFWDSVQKTEDLLFELLEYRPTILREPGGRFRTLPEKQEMVRDKGYQLVMWNIDSYDSRMPVPDAETIFANVKRQAQKEKLWPAMVLLFHETGGHESTVEALPSVIEYLLDEGFVFKTIPEMDAQVLANLPKP